MFFAKWVSSVPILDIPDILLWSEKLVRPLAGVGRRGRQGALSQVEHHFTMMIWGLITGTWKPYHRFQTVFFLQKPKQLFILLSFLPFLSIVFFLPVEINLDHIEYLGLVCMLSCVVKNSDKLYNFTSDPYLVFACFYMFTTEFGQFYPATDIFHFRVQFYLTTDVFHVKAQKVDNERQDLFCKAI